MKFILNILVKTLAVLIVAYLMPGVNVTNVFYAILVAVSLSFLNTVLKPLMIILTIPVTIVTLGLFLIVINAFIVMIADYFIEGFEVNGFITALFFSIVLSLVTSLLEWIANFKAENEDQ